MILLGNCLDRLTELPDNSVDSVVTDPPYELGFMGKTWDNSGIANNPEMWREVLRVLKPGGHLLSFSGTRTYHRQAVAIEDAGFEIRDMVEWVYGSGFPKSTNIAIRIDKEKGLMENRGVGTSFARKDMGDGNILENGKAMPNHIGISPEAKQYQGWGTALKPAHEPICLARKPIEGTVANNVLKYGTGGLNIDKSRVGTGTGETKSVSYANIKGKDGLNAELSSVKDRIEIEVKDIGRFPANFIHDGSDEVVREFPNSKSTGGTSGTTSMNKQGYGFGSIEDGAGQGGYKDNGSAARFFKSFIYCPKASKSERDRGCEGMEDVEWWNLNEGGGKELWKGQEDYRQGKKYQNHPSKNYHPTVKPLALMKYLIQMITPEGGVVLDPFAGSGSTLVAAKELGYDFIGIEMTEEYIPIIEARLEAVKNIQERLI